MALFNKIDLSLVCLQLAETARIRAECVNDSESREVWYSIAHDWELLARFRGERCVCGRLAIGSKLYDDGGRVALCGKHLGEAIANTTAASRF